MAIVVATACLHNLARRRNDPIPHADDPMDNTVPEQPNPIDPKSQGGPFIYP